MSIVALLLVFSSNIVTLANDIKAVNAFIAAGKAAVAAAAKGAVDGTTTGNATLNAMLDFDYIAYVVSFFSGVRPWVSWVASC